jgi:hypothetical protein
MFLNSVLIVEYNNMARFVHNHFANPISSVTSYVELIETLVDSLDYSKLVPFETLLNGPPIDIDASLCVDYWWYQSTFSHVGIDNFKRFLKYLAAKTIIANISGKSSYDDLRLNLVYLNTNCRITLNFTNDKPASLDDPFSGECLELEHYLNVYASYQHEQHSIFFKKEQLPTLRYHEHTYIKYLELEHHYLYGEFKLQFHLDLYYKSRGYLMEEKQRQYHANMIRHMTYHVPCALLPEGSQGYQDMMRKVVLLLCN